MGEYCLKLWHDIGPLVEAHSQQLLRDWGGGCTVAAVSEQQQLCGGYLLREAVALTSDRIYSLQEG